MASPVPVIELRAVERSFLEAGRRRLVLDGDTETFVGDTEANALLTRTYRPPFVVPQEV